MESVQGAVDRGDERFDVAIRGSLKKELDYPVGERSILRKGCRKLTFTCGRTALPSEAPINSDSW